jgi:two-component system, NtrC family, C4-dicarboxylate transport sensor histidine kinase DctB
MSPTGSRGPGLTRAFDRFIEQQDEILAREAASPRAWLMSSAFVCLFLPLLAWGPGASAYFGLRFWPALICYVPALAVGLAWGFWHADGKRISRAGWVWELFDCVLVQFFCASLIVWCSPEGAAAISSLFIFAAAYHGHLFRVTLSEPFLAVGTLAAAAATSLLDRTGERRQLFAFVGVAAVAAELLVGTNARRWHQARSRTDQLRAAIDANILDERSRELKRLSDTLVDVLARNHDMNNALMALRLSAEALGIECQRQGVRGVERIVADLRDGLQRIGALGHGIRDAGRTEGAAVDGEAVDVMAVIDNVLHVVRARFPGVRLVLVGDRATALRVSMRGGALTLHRVLENLILNACEGDGQRGARTVEIKVFRDPSGGRVQLAIRDDGPGFRAAQLAGDIEVFASTKPQGSGLGLYTCERLVRASGGQLERANPSGGGACVTAILPLIRG